MKKKSHFLLILLLVCMLVGNLSEISFAEDEIGSGINDIVQSIDTTEIDKLFEGLNEEEIALLGGESIEQRINRFLAGESQIEYDSLLDYIISLLFGGISNYLPFVTSLLVIAIFVGIFNAVKGNFAEQSIESIVRFASIAVMLVITLAQVATLVSDTTNLVENLHGQMQAVFPILLTLMSAIGSNKGVALYQPAIAVIGTALTQLVTYLILPCIIVGICFGTIGALSEEVKLKKISNFVQSALKWTLGTGFFVFVAYLSVQGITAATYDNLYVRATKLAINQYVPIIGGSLSEGYNLVMAGSVIVKNCIGESAIIILILTVLPVIVHIGVFSLGLNFVSAVAESFGGGIGRVADCVSSSIKLLTSLVLGVAFLYFVFLLLIIFTGNLSL